MSRSIFAAGGGRVFSIPAAVSFVETLASGLMAEAGGDPAALAAMTVLLPNRRSCRALREAFLRLAAESGCPALLLPRLLPIGDLDDAEIALTGAAIGESLDVPPAIAPLRRQLLLARLIARSPAITGGAVAFHHAVRLAGELADLLDQTERANLDLADLPGLVQEAELAAHWQKTLDFLGILREHWPAILAGEKAMEPVLRQTLLLQRQAQNWQAQPPPGPVIAAGSAASIPASAELIATVANLPRGCVVLPGLDLESGLDDSAWEAIADDPSHPQFGMAGLLDKLGVARQEVEIWPHLPQAAEPRTPAARARILACAMLPAKETERWPDLAATLGRDAAALAWSGVQRIDARSEQEEASIIALLLREAVAKPPPYRAALVTPDRALARRVAAELGRWRIAIDDSAGRPLSQTPPGSFFLAIAAAAAEQLAPAPLLAMLKHGFAGDGAPPAAYRAELAAFERSLLRGPRPAPGLDGLAAAFRAGGAAAEAARPMLLRLQRLLLPLLAASGESPGEILRRHVELAEALAAGAEEGGAARLWRGEAGEALALGIADFSAALAGMPELDLVAYHAVLAEVLGAIEVRPRYGRHPRLAILGQIEARLLHFDLTVLGGLNEGTWPRATALDPWLSRSMRARFGLPAPETRIGLAAHDFQQAFGAPRVVLTRASRVAGAPTAPSRWLLRLDAFLQLLGLSWDGAAPSRYRDLHARLDRPARVTPVPRPAPRPGLKHRPRELSVTRIETWMRDPYALYAEKILRLKALPPLDEDPGAADFGSIVHDVLEEFIRLHPNALPPDAERVLAALGGKHFAPLLARPGVGAFWLPRFARMARWVVSQFRTEDPRPERRLVECEGRLPVPGIVPPFTLRGRADRIDVFADGSLAIVDYKTGKLPKANDIALGFAAQMALEGWMAEAGGFPGIAAARIERLGFWHLKAGRDEAGEEALIHEPAARIAEAKAGLLALLHDFSRDEAVYEARPREEFALLHNDYDHLERAAEWLAAVGEEN